MPAPEYEPSTYGDRIAGVYDELYRRPGDAEEAAQFLSQLVGQATALELGIGTGRVALPLAARGVEIQGIDASDEMVSRMRAKPGGADILVTKGDFADVAVDGRFRLIFVVFNTFFSLLTQEDQVRCFANVAAHLDQQGVFVIQAFVPDMSLYERGSRVAVLELGTDNALIDLGRLDVAAQEVVAQHLVIDHGQVKTYPIRLRYAWPAELDLMARLGGLRLRERWGGWKHEVFTANSTQHISVYERAG